MVLQDNSNIQKKNLKKNYLEGGGLGKKNALFFSILLIGEKTLKDVTRGLKYS